MSDLEQRVSAPEAEVRRLREPCGECGEPAAPAIPRTGEDAARMMREAWPLRAPAKWEGENCESTGVVYAEAESGGVRIGVRRCNGSGASRRAGWDGWITVRIAGETSIVVDFGDEKLDDFSTDVTRIRAAHARLLADLRALAPAAPPTSDATSTRTAADVAREAVAGLRLDLWGEREALRKRLGAELDALTTGPDGPMRHAVTCPVCGESYDLAYVAIEPASATAPPADPLPAEVKAALAKYGEHFPRRFDWTHCDDSSGRRWLVLACDGDVDVCRVVERYTQGAGGRGLRPVPDRSRVAPDGTITREATP